MLWFCSSTLLSFSARHCVHQHATGYASTCIMLSSIAGMQHALCARACHSMQAPCSNIMTVAAQLACLHTISNSLI